MKFTNQQIQQLLIEKISGTIDANDDIVLEQLLQDNEAISQQYQTMKAAVQDAEASGFILEGAVEKSWQDVASGMVQPGRKTSLINMFALAAAILAALVTGWFLLGGQEKNIKQVSKRSPPDKQRSVTISLDNGQTVNLTNTTNRRFTFGNAVIATSGASLSYTTSSTDIEHWATLSVPAVFDYKLTLADGTEVWLNSETILRFPLKFAAVNREVYVEGEAYFNVAKNRRHPFVVHANKTAIRVLGTKFNVNTYDADKVTTSLVEGAVDAGGARKEVHLKPGFEATFHRLQNGFNIAAFDKSERLSWMNGVYFFHNTHLRDLSKLLTRWYNVKVTFQNPALQDKTFSGEIIKKQSIQFFLDNLKISNQLAVDLKDGVVTFH